MRLKQNEPKRFGGGSGCLQKFRQFFCSNQFRLTVTGDAGRGICQSINRALTLTQSINLFKNWLIFPSADCRPPRWRVRSEIYASGRLSSSSPPATDRRRHRRSGAACELIGCWQAWGVVCRLLVVSTVLAKLEHVLCILQNEGGFPAHTLLSRYQGVKTHSQLKMCFSYSEHHSLGRFLPFFPFPATLYIVSDFDKW